MYRDGDAFVDHSRNVGDLAPAVFDAGPVVHIDVIGEVNEGLRQRLAFANVAYPNRLGKHRFAGEAPDDRLGPDDGAGWDAVAPGSRRPSHGRARPADGRLSG